MNIFLIVLAILFSEEDVIVRYRFDGSANPDGHDKSERFDLRSVSFRENAVYLNGKYENNLEDPGYRAVCYTPKLDYRNFTVAVRTKADTYTSEKNVIVFGGRSYRWFGLQRSDSGNIQAVFNNGDFVHEFEGTSIKAGAWIVVVCSVSLDSGEVRLALDGKNVGGFKLPKDFRLDVLSSNERGKDKVWTFTNYAAGHTFQGLVDDFLLFDSALDADALARVLKMDAADDQP